MRPIKLPDGRAAFRFNSFAAALRCTRWTLQKHLHANWKSLRDPIHDDEVIAAIMDVPMHRACLDVGVPFSAVSNTSTAKTNVGAKSPANQALRVWGINIGFDGTTSTNGPALVEVGTCTFATNSPGTAST